jgi:glycerol dehydrogenase-like iron-containing ADH family enzyme
LEKLVPRSYIHGSLIALNCLVVLRLQGENAVFDLRKVKAFLDKVQVNYAPKFQNISRSDYKKALENVQQYTKDEKLFHGLWYLENPFKEVSIDEILRWIYDF